MLPMHPHPALSQALMTVYSAERTRVRRRRYRPSGGAAVRMFRPPGHGASSGALAPCAACPNA